MYGGLLRKVCQRAAGQGPALGAWQIMGFLCCTNALKILYKLTSYVGKGCVRDCSAERANAQPGAARLLAHGKPSGFSCTI